METAAVSNITDLWEAWIDLGPGTMTLYVLGNIYTGRSRTVPVLLKKRVQGAPASHLILEVMPYLNGRDGRLAEISYSEPITNIHKYKHIFICAGEEIIARISDIEIVNS